MQKYQHLLFVLRFVPYGTALAAVVEKHRVSFIKNYVAQMSSGYLFLRKLRIAHFLYGGTVRFGGFIFKIFFFAAVHATYATVVRRMRARRYLVFHCSTDPSAETAYFVLSCRRVIR